MQHFLYNYCFHQWFWFWNKIKRNAQQVNLGDTHFAKFYYNCGIWRNVEDSGI